MATRMNDGSLLIEGAVDGFSQPLFAKKVKGVSTPALMEHLIEHGRPPTQPAKLRQEIIKSRIKSMQALNPSLTFAQAWARLQVAAPELFD